jgi:hypothetical protein
MAGYALGAWRIFEDGIGKGSTADLSGLAGEET